MPAISLTQEMFWVLKDPIAHLDYAMDWSVWLGADTIASSVWIVPAPLVSLSESIPGNIKSLIWLAGGVAGNTVRIKNQITTVGGRIDERSVDVQVVNR